MRMWPKRKPSSPGSVRPVGSDQLLAHERHQVRADRGSLGLGQRARRPPRGGRAGPRPSRARAAARSVRARAGRCARRAAPGASAAPRARRPRSRPASRRAARRRAGCPRPPRRCAHATRPGRRRAAPRAPRSSSRASGSSVTSVAFGFGAAQVGRGSKQVGSRGAQDEAAGRPARTPRRTRSGRGTSARPSGCRRRRRPAAARRASASKQPADAPGDLLGRHGRVGHAERGLDPDRDELGVVERPAARRGRSPTCDAISASGQ